MDSIFFYRSYDEYFELLMEDFNLNMSSQLLINIFILHHIIIQLITFENCQFNNSLMFRKHLKMISIYN